MAAHITDHLRRRIGPDFRNLMLGITVYLRMHDTAYKSESDSCFMPRTTDDEGTLSVIAERSSQTVPEFITESRDTRHLVGIVLHGQLFFRQLRSTRRPSFTINVDSRINLVQSFPDCIHRFNIMNTHQIETEAVDMVFLRPIADRLYHKLTHHGPFTGCLVPASRSVGKLSVLVLTIKITGYRTLEITSIGHRCMIIYHIHNDTDTGFMERHHHLFEFTDTHFRPVRIGRI